MLFDVSLPISRGDPPAAMMAAAPPLLPPGVLVRSYGFEVRPYRALSVSSDIVISGVFVLPSRIAPAARSRATTVASADGTRFAQPFDPAVVITPATSRESFAVNGTP